MHYSYLGFSEHNAPGQDQPTVIAAITRSWNLHSCSAYQSEPVLRVFAKFDLTHDVELAWELIHIAGVGDVDPERILHRSDPIEQAFKYIL